MIGSEYHASLNLEASHQTFTLLKNDGNILPLDVFNDASFHSIAVIGPHFNATIALPTTEYTGF